MNASEFVEWAWSLPDDDKPALAKRVAAVREGTDERFLREARAAAETVVSDSEFNERRASLSASAAPQDWLDRDLEGWNRETGSYLRDAYEDALLALEADQAIGKAHRRALAGPLIDEVGGLAEALKLA